MKQDLEEAGKKISQLEEAQLEHMRDADELRSNIREIENARQEARKELQQLHNQVQMLTRHTWEIIRYLSDFQIFWPHGLFERSIVIALFC